MPLHLQYFHLLHAAAPAVLFLSLTRHCTCSISVSQMPLDLHISVSLHLTQTGSSPTLSTGDFTCMWMIHPMPQPLSNSHSSLVPQCHILLFIITQSLLPQVYSQNKLFFLLKSLLNYSQHISSLTPWSRFLCGGFFSSLYIGVADFVPSATFLPIPLSPLPIAFES